MVKRKSLKGPISTKQVLTQIQKILAQIVMKSEIYDIRIVNDVNELLEMTYLHYDSPIVDKKPKKKKCDCHNHLHMVCDKCAG